MITYEDCLALADLAPEEVDRVAAREGMTAFAALGLASRLAAAAEGGRDSVRRIAGAAVPGVVDRPAPVDLPPEGGGGRSTRSRSNGKCGVERKHRLEATLRAG